MSYKNPSTFPTGARYIPYYERIKVSNQSDVSTEVANQTQSVPAQVTKENND